MRLQFVCSLIGASPAFVFSSEQYYLEAENMLKMLHLYM